MYKCLIRVNSLKYKKILTLESNLHKKFHRYDRLLREVTIVLVGKYTKLEDAYASVIKALQHSALAVSHRLNLKVRVCRYNVLVKLCRNVTGRL